MFLYYWTWSQGPFFTHHAVIVDREFVFILFENHYANLFSFLTKIF